MTATHLGETLAHDADVPVGHDVYDDVLDVPTAGIGGKHLLVAGATGAGKTKFLQGYLCGLAHHEHTALMLIDPKRVEFRPKLWGPRASCIVVGDEPTVPALEQLHGEMLRRFDWAEENDLNDWPVGPGQPRIICVIDEVANLDLSTGKEGQRRTKLIGDLLAMGRAAGIGMVLCTQRPSFDIIPLKIRDNCRVRVCFATEGATATRMVLGDDLPDLQYMPHSGIPESAPGVGVVRLDRRLVEFRAWAIEDHEVREAVSATAGLRVELPGFAPVMRSTKESI
jgi:S-DNA-T family DNA segregation ATPase FtsK/SpoIIIE